MYGDELVRAFDEFKAIFDPDGRMNPGKVVRANPLDGELRLGAGYRPPAGPTALQLPRATAASPAYPPAASGWAPAAAGRPTPA